MRDMESSLVIKVKYGGTLRRFSAHVDENNQLELDMIGLRAKILSLFNFPADANLMLRYVDEDGDLVTLVDDDDLHDVMRQRLKFLRIDVHMSSDSGGKSNAWSSGSATPLRSPRVLDPFPSGNFVIADDALKSVPEPIREAVSNLSRYVVSKAASSSPVLGNIVDSISNKSSGSGGKSNPRSSGSAIPLRSPPVPNPFPSVKVVIGDDALKSNARPSGSATPLRSPPVPNPFPGVNVVIADDALKSNASGSATPLRSPPVPNPFPSVKVVIGDDALKSNARSSGSATPLRSPPVPNPFPSVNVVIADDALKSVPEPIREAVSSLSHYGISKAASSSPVFANIVDSISKMGQSIPNSHCQPHVAAGPSSKNGVPEEPVTPEARGPQAARVDSTSKASQQVEAGNVTRDAVAEVASVDLNILPCDPRSTNVITAPLSSGVPDGDGEKGKTSTDDSFAGKGDSSGTSTGSTAPNNSSTHPTARSFSPLVDCPFSGAYAIDSVVPSFIHRIHPFKRSHSHTDATSGMFHKGVRCDGCGVYPITGPRFKSKVKENYDLCSICFNEMGNQTDYIRMDRPVSFRGPRNLKGVYEHPPGMGAPTIPHIFKTGAMLKHARPKLDSRFILDVNVIDGTMMAPFTAFTKIWRMRNNGTIAWPKGTQLVWIGGDNFSDFHSVDLEVPEEGVLVDKELDIAIDFRAPQLPGRYISYWMMATPAGQKFGQRVWVLIQVDASLKDSFYDSSQGLNLNIPLDVNGPKGPQIVDINVHPNENDAFLQPQNPIAPTEPVNQMVDKQPRQELENELPKNEATFVGHAASPPATTAAPSSISYPIIDFSETASAVPSNQRSSAAPSSVSYPIIDLSETAPAVPSNQQSSAKSAPSSSLEIGGNNSVEETLLKELEEMGFKQVDLNKEILRINEYDLEQSVDDLCGVSEWDPLLEELQEMGFRDNEVNKRLLMKNNGSIKRVVMDLINREKV